MKHWLKAAPSVASKNMNTSADAERVTFQDGKRSISPLSDECICNLYLEPVLADTFGDFCQEPGSLLSAKNGSGTSAEQKKRFNSGIARISQTPPPPTPQFGQLPPLFPPSRPFTRLFP